MKFDHVALRSENIERSIEWYQQHCDAKVLYQDETWGLIDANGGKIAFVISHQHPPHVGICIDKLTRETRFAGKVFKKHRDGSSSCFVKDPDGNFVEFLLWDE